MDTIGIYEEKRDFARSPEPAGGRRRPSRGAPRFVIQQHEATSMHYDFRLEVDGVLKSWAVPKGPSTDPRQRRMARPTEDHPLEYADFEGVIPAGQYGAGAVLVWDTGTYRYLPERDGEDVAAAIERGHVAFWLDGEKLSGGFALTRMDGGEPERWLLVKMSDQEADARRNPVWTQPESVRSAVPSRTWPLSRRRDKPDRNRGIHRGYPAPGQAAVPGRHHQGSPPVSRGVG